MSAEQQQREQRERHGDVGDDRARQRRIDRDVEQFRHRHALVAAQHFADAVVDDHRVIERIAQDGEQRRDARQVEIDLGERHVAHRKHKIVDVRHHGAERELPFEAEPQVDQDREDREHEPDGRVGQKLRRHARADYLDAAVVDVGAQGLADFGDGGLLRRIATGLLRDPDQHVGRAAELLQLDVAEIETRQCRAHLGKVGRSGLRLHFDQRAADEIDPEIEPVEEVQHDRDDRQHRGRRKADAPETHEVKFGIVRDDPKQRNGGMQAHVCSKPMRSPAAAGACTSPTRLRSAA